MITNLFSIFEPSSRLNNLPLNWLSSLLGLIFFPYLFWASPSRWSLLWSKIILILHNEFKTILGNFNKIRTIIFVSLFSFIIFNNLLGLLPHVFTRSRHIVITLSISLPIWLTFIIFGWFFYPNHMFAHLMPQGTPPILIPFIVLIETVRNIIRPATLAIRLAANIMAGHLLLSLLGNNGPSLGWSFLIIVLLISQILLIILEFAVAIIQSYVFAVLSTLFAREIN